MDLLEKALKKIEASKTIQEESITPGEKIKISIKEPDTETKPKIIFGDKKLNKNQMILWFKEYVEKNRDNYTLDWLRGQKLTFESVNEMRKER